MPLKSKTEVFGFQWNFGELEFGCGGNYALYSEQHGLLSIGGTRRNCDFQMDFNECLSKTKLQWKQMPGMLKDRCRVII